MSEALTTPIRRHYVELDSLRGVAALIVVFHHFSMTWGGSAHSEVAFRFWEMPPMRYVLEGHRAVVLFFLLSGFVLALPQLRGERPAYVPYLLKRICRIYIPYVFALALAVAGCWIFHGTQAYGGWFAQTWSAAPTWRLIAAHLLFIGNYPDNAYNTAFWSLVQEMRISLVFPFLCAAVIGMGWRRAIWMPPLLMTFARVLELRSLLPSHVAWTVGYAGCFVLGILLAQHREVLEAWLGSLPGGLYLLFTMTSFALYCVPNKVGALGNAGQLGTDLVTSFGAVGLMLLSLSHAPAIRFLRGKAPVFLGRISYSLYLLHGTVLYLAAYLVSGRILFSRMLLPVVVVSLVAATGMYEWVEVPSIRLGRTLARRVGRGLPAEG